MLSWNVVLKYRFLGQPFLYFSDVLFTLVQYLCISHINVLSSLTESFEFSMVLWLCSFSSSVLTPHKNDECMGTYMYNNNGLSGWTTCVIPWPRAHLRLFSPSPRYRHNGVYTMTAHADFYMCFYFTYLLFIFRRQFLPTKWPASKI